VRLFRLEGGRKGRVIKLNSVCCPRIGGQDRNSLREICQGFCVPLINIIVDSAFQDVGGDAGQRARDPCLRRSLTMFRGSDIIDTFYLLGS
jgi:hypothetical protein